MAARSVLFLQHDVGVQIPDDVWTPVPYNVIRTITGDMPAILPGFVSPPPTTIAVASNGQALPQGTINVASTAGFPLSGYILIRIGATDRVVKYTGKTTTQFTGCTLGVGTMTTGDAVRQGLVDMAPPLGTIWNATAEWAWTSNATGVRGTRFRDGSGFAFEAGGDVRPAVATPAAAPLRSWASEQPGSPNGPGASGLPFHIECYQNSTTVGGLATLQSGTSLGYPRLVAAHLIDL